VFKGGVYMEKKKYKFNTTNKSGEIVNIDSMVCIKQIK
jgi:hypothetical protein